MLETTGSWMVICADSHKESVWLVNTTAILVFAYCQHPYAQWRINPQASIGCSLGAHTDQGPLIGQKKIHK